MEFKCVMCGAVSFGKTLPFCDHGNKLGDVYICDDCAQYPDDLYYVYDVAEFPGLFPDFISKPFEEKDENT